MWKCCRRSLLWCGLLAIAPAGAGAQSTPGAMPPGVAIWSATRLTETADALEARLGTQAMVFETIGSYPGHSIYLVLRGETARAEYHETESDYYVAVRGRATLVVGGTLLDPESLPRKQRRGSGIAGGVRRTLGAGDVVHIPPALPHQLIIAEGERFIYQLVKLDEEPVAR